jgi:hypothetical protein
MMTDLDGEHVAMRAALTDAYVAMHDLRGGPSADRAAVARGAVARPADVPLSHLEHEKRDLEPIAAANLSSPPMKAALKQVKEAHRGRLGNVLAWLQDGADEHARRFVRHEIPVVYVATNVAGRRYRRDIATIWA